MTPKVLYSGFFASHSGMGQACRNFIKALHEAGVEVTTDLVKNLTSGKDLGEEYKFAEKLHGRPLDYKFKIIHVTPDLITKHLEPMKYHIFHLFWEVDSLPDWWVWSLNLCDEIWTGSEWNKKVFIESGVKKPITVIPQPVEIGGPHKPLKIKASSKEIHDFKFYSVFQWIERKDPRSLLQAYWREFEGEENVSLVLKTYREMFTKEETMNIIKDILKWKGELNQSHFPKVFIYPDLMSKNMLNKFYASGDCFVSSHRGEGWCWKIDTSIKTYGGVKSIQDCDDELVLTHTGKYQKAKVISRDYDGDFINIKAWGLPRIGTTPNHKILINRDKKISWIEASNIKKGDFVCVPRNKRNQFGKSQYINTKKYVLKKLGHCHKLPKQIVIDEDLAFLMGLFVADGSTHAKKAVVFSINTTTKNYLEKKIIKISEKLFGITPTIENRDRHRKNVIINSSVLGRFFAEMFGTGAKNKKIPMEIYDSPNWVVKSFIRGAYAGDGSIFSNSKENYYRTSYSSISKNLAFGIYSLLSGFLSYPIDLKETKKRTNKEYKLETNNISATNEILCLLESDISNSESKRPYLVKNWSDNNYYYYKVKEISKEHYKGKVYNLSVLGDESYNTYFAVHNCIPVAEAMLSGKPVITTNLGGITEYIKDYAGLVKYQWTNVFNMDFVPWYNKEQKWAQIDITDLRKKMRWIFNNQDKANVLGKKAKVFAEDKFSFKAVGNLMKKRLEEIELEIKA